MAYTPGALPKETPPYLMREFLSISAGLEEARQIINIDPLYVEPPKPREGMVVAAASPWNPGYGAGPYIYQNNAWFPLFGGWVPEAAVVACSDEDSDLTTGLKRTWYLPYSEEMSEVIADVVTAPTDAALIVDVKVAGVSILSTKPQIQSGEFSSLTGTEAVLSSTTFSKGDKVTIHIDQIGSTVAGTGLKVSFVWVRT
jgi:hypothetical protein